MILVDRRQNGDGMKYETRGMLIAVGFEVSQNLTSKTNNFYRSILNIQDSMPFPY